METRLSIVIKKRKKLSKKEPTSSRITQIKTFFDGGYYQKALKTLNKIDNPMLLSNGKHIIEYFYRKGRIYDEMENIILAKENYKKTIDLGRNTNYFFAAKSALQLAFIHEKNGEYTKAIYFLKNVLPCKIMSTNKV